MNPYIIPATLGAVAALPGSVLALAEIGVRRGRGYDRVAYVTHPEWPGRVFELHYRVKFNHEWPKRTPWHEGAVTYKPLYSRRPVIMVLGSYLPPRMHGHELGHVLQWYLRGSEMYVDYLVEVAQKTYRKAGYEKNADFCRDWFLRHHPDQIPGLSISTGVYRVTPVTDDDLRDLGPSLVRA